MRAAVERDISEGFVMSSLAGFLLRVCVEFRGDPVNLVDEGIVITLLVDSESVQRQAAAELSVELSGGCHLGRREESAGCKIVLLVAGLLRLDDV